MAEECVRVWVVDDQAGFRRATAATLDATDGFLMAGECETGEAAVEMISTAEADLVLMDIHMPGIGGIEATRRLHAAHPGLTVVLMSTYELEDLPAAASACGATGYLKKELLSPESLSRMWQTAG
ncbi:response regulator [Mycobacterium sp. E740]|nr:response regulator [Mycobacterium sp. E740]